MELTITTPQLWPREAKVLIKQRELSVHRLEEAFNDIVFPWDVSYDKDRTVFSLICQMRPLFIVTPTSNREVRSILELAVLKNLNLRVLVGRHWSLFQHPDALVNMTSFKRIRFNKTTGILRVDAGLTQGQVNQYVFDHSDTHHFPGARITHPSLAFPAGSAVTVGVSGITSIGGIGTLKRTVGLTIDSVLGFKITVPPSPQAGECPEHGEHGKARTLKANAVTNPNLFWALRGGGGNFGLISQITYRLPTIGSVISYSVKLEWSNAENVLAIWQETAPNRSQFFNEDIALFTTVGPVPGIAVAGVYVVPDGQSTAEAIVIINTQLEPLGGVVQIGHVGSYSKFYHKLAVDRVYFNFSRGKTFFTQNVISAHTVVQRIEAGQGIGSILSVSFDLMGGVIKDVPSDATAFFPRQSLFFVDIFSFWQNQQLSLRTEAWNLETFRTLYDPSRGDIVYLGFPGDALQPVAYWGPNLPRLEIVKREYNPTDVLSYPSSL